MALPEGHWRGEWTAIGPDWDRSWQNQHLPDEVSLFLRSELPWPHEDNVYFFWSRNVAVQVPWGVFLRTWRSFLLADDEGPFLIRFQSPEFVWFGPTSIMGLGRRKPLTVSPVV